jgi:predicted ATPase
VAYRSFKVGPLKGLRQAACDPVPNLMVICGPNGVGKSSLLRLLRDQAGAQAEPNTKVSTPAHIDLGASPN